MMQFEHLGPYKVGEKLGKGGMGAVYRAVHKETGQPAAIKVLAPQLAMAEGFRERFEAEIDSLKKLDHPGIVRLYGYGEQDGFLFYAMELIDGTSLEDELAQGRRFNWREVTSIGIQICRALKHAHDHGIVHRDIKPANLLLDKTEKIKIADFGIARLFGGTQLTTAGGVLGTADYMSPEQADGKNVTERCDQYSLGGVMYALLAGRPPFRGKNLPEMLQLQRFAEPEPVRRYASETPEQLERLIMQLLSKDPAARFPNTLVLARHMEAMLRALSRPAADDFDIATGDTKVTIDDGYAESTFARGPTRVAEQLDDEDEYELMEQETLTPSIGVPSTPDVTMEAPQGLTGPLTQPVGSGDDLELERPTASSRSGESQPVPRQTHFTTVEEEALLAAEEGRQPWYVTLSQLIVLSGVLAAVAYGLWYFSRPATADQLYAQITEAALTGSSKSLRAAEKHVAAFIERFPEDRRIEEVVGYQEQIELSRTEDQLGSVSQRLGGTRALLPIEQMYLEAQRVAEVDLTAALARVDAILTLYDRGDLTAPGSGDDDDDDTVPFFSRMRRSILLVRRLREDLQQRSKIESDNQMPTLRQRLAEAQVLAAEDPREAEAMFNAIVLLYADKDWAADVVAAARDGLAALPEPTSGDDAVVEQPEHQTAVEQ